MPKVKKEKGSSSNNDKNAVARKLHGQKTGVASAAASQDHQPLRKSRRLEPEPEQRGSVDEEEEEQDEVVVRRNLRSKYLKLKNLLSGAGDDLSRPDSDKFKIMIDEVESLHKKVRKPREQVADAEALYDITSSFVKSVKAQKNEGVSPSDFVSCLLRDFGQQGRSTSSVENSRNSILWKDIGLAVSHIFKKGTGCHTMLGPMSSELKKRKAGVRKKHLKPTDTSRPEKLDNTTEEKTDTDKNMSIMFDILKKYRKVQLENLLLNRTSFAQTTENLFALSFLLKDGRAEVTVNENGHFVCPMNAPSAEAVTSGKVSYSHFVFRFDFKDWKLMLDSVTEGEELMPHRVVQAAPSNCPEESVQADTCAHSDCPEESENANLEKAATSTPIRKFSRNRGLVLQEQTVVEGSPESDENRSRSSCIRKGKRKILRLG